MRFTWGAGLALALGLLGCANQDLLAPEKVQSVAPNPGNGPVVGRFRAEIAPKAARMDVFRILPGDFILRAAPMATGVNYDYSGTVAQDNTCDADGSDPDLANCVGLSGVVNLYTLQSSVTYIEGGDCYNNGSVHVGDTTCGGLYASVTHPCRQERMFCGPVRMLSFMGANRGIQDPILDIAEVGGQTAIDGCIDDASGSLGTCAANGALKLADDSFTPAITPEAGLVSCSYCYGNFATATTLNRLGLRHAVVPGVNSTLSAINTDTIAIRIDAGFDSNNGFDIDLVVHESLPAFDAEGSQIQYTDNTGSTAGVTQCWGDANKRFRINGGAFGPKASCFAGSTPTTCNVTLTGSSNVAGAYFINAEGITGTDNADLWQDHAIVSNNAGPTLDLYGCGITVTTPAGSATTDDDILVCPNLWRDWTPGGTSLTQGAGGLLGDDVIQFGGRSTPNDILTGTTTVLRLPIPRCGASEPAATTVASTPPANIGVWGQAHAVGSGGLYVFGGSNADASACSDVAAVLAWDAGTATASWTTLTPMPVALCQASAARITDSGNGRELIVITGGLTGGPRGGTGTPQLNSGTLIYDVADDSWSASLTGVARYNMGSTGSGTTAYFIGGGTNAAGNATVTTTTMMTVTNGTPSTSAGAALPAARALPAVLVQGGFVYALGGASSTANGASGTTTAVRSSTALDAWSAVQSMPNASAAAIVVDSAFDETPPRDDLSRPLIVFGHRNGTTVAPTAQEYNP